MNARAKSVDTFSVPVRFTGPTGDSVGVDALVDTGATYPVLESDVLLRLGVRPVERRRFRLADESIMERDVGEIRVEYEGRQVPLLVVFGPIASEALLGATALENLGLGVDSVSERLVPVDGLLK